MNRASLRCINCQARFKTDQPRYRCTACGDLLDVVYDWKGIDPERLKRLWTKRLMSSRPIDRSGVWRYRELIPFFDDESQIVTYPEGNTPLLDAPRSARYSGLRRLTVKHQGFNPTGSFKDNGMATGVTEGKILGMTAVLCASTGNTSASMAAYAARAGMLGIVLVPDGQITFGKLSQALDYGALTLMVQGDFDVAQQLMGEVADEIGIYVLNSINPFRLEGQKTIAIELLHQLDWKPPDRIVLPGGNLGNSSAIGKGLKELFDLGFINKIPRVTVVQASGADPFYRTMTSGDPTNLITVHAKTLATAIKIGKPVSWKKAMRAVDWTNGWVAEVSEQSIADAKATIGRDGIGCEPASAAAIAGIAKLVASGTDTALSPEENVVAILTGNVLKDPDYTVRYHVGELYEEFVTETRVIQCSQPIAGTFANRPIRVAGDRAAIVAAIEEFRRAESAEPLRL
ncbi:MAG: threonine synthase [Dehalococcoidia bacterium]